MIKLIKGIFRLFFLIIIIGVLVFAYSRYIEPFQLKVKEVSVFSPHVSNSAEGIKILAFADTHFGRYYTKEHFIKVLNKIEELKPDIVVFLGDLIDNYRRYTQTEDVGEISDMLGQIQASYGKFAVYGNHDYGGGAENICGSILAGGGFSVLANDSAVIDKLNIKIFGIDDVVIGYGDPSVVSNADEESFNLVLSHAPDVANDILDYNADLILSGHTHGRQVNIKYFDKYILPLYGRKYIRGLYTLNTERDAHIYVNSGIGMTKLPFRFMSPPELTIITLHSD